MCPVNIRPVPDLHHDDHQNVILNLVDDAIDALAAADTVPERRVFRIPGAGGFQPAAQSISGYDGCPLWEGPGDLCQKCFVGPLRFFDPLVKRRKILLVFAKCHANGFIDEISHGTSRIERLEAQSAVKFGVPSRPIWHHNVMLSMHHNVT